METSLVVLASVNSFVFGNIDERKAQGYYSVPIPSDCRCVYPAESDVISCRKTSSPVVLILVGLLAFLSIEFPIWLGDDLPF